MQFFCLRRNFHLLWILFLLPEKYNTLSFHMNAAISQLRKMKDTYWWTYWDAWWLQSNQMHIFKMKMHQRLLIHIEDEAFIFRMFIASSSLKRSKDVDSTAKWKQCWLERSNLNRSRIMTQTWSLTHDLNSHLSLWMRQRSCVINVTLRHHNLLWSAQNVSLH